MMVKVGTPAPDFSLYNTSKEHVRLSDLRGENIVLLFFPLAFTSVCTEELCEVRDNFPSFVDADARVFGISVDSLHSLNKFRETLKLPFELLSDFNKEVSRAYGAIYEEFGYDMRGVSKRAAFVIDKEGNLRHAEILEDAGQIPDFRALHSVLDEI